MRRLNQLPEAERVEAYAEAIELAGGEAPTAAVVTSVVERRRTPMPVPKPRVAERIPPHPAAFSEAVMAVIVKMLQKYARPPVTIVDPYAGVGTIHQLASWGTTIGVELEREWAAADLRTIVGNSRQLVEIVGANVADFLVTSPSFGNRLADPWYEAYDAEARHSYALDLGRPLTEGNGAALKFTGDPGGEYELLHADVWAECDVVLKPDGLVIFTCKDFKADDEVMSPTAWHLRELRRLGFEVIDFASLPAAGLAMTKAPKFSELVFVMERRVIAAETGHDAFEEPSTGRMVDAASRAVADAANLQVDAVHRLLGGDRWADYDGHLGPVHHDTFGEFLLSQKGLGIDDPAAWLATSASTRTSRRERTRSRPPIWRRRPCYRPPSLRPWRPLPALLPKS